MKNHIYLGIKKWVVSIDSTTGREQWRCKLKSSSLINVVVVGNVVIAHSRGILYGVDRVSGRLLWENGLAGLGYGACLIATEGTPSSQQMQQAIMRASRGNDAADGDIGD